MSAFYDLYETPDPNDTGEKQPLHARIVPSGTYPVTNLSLTI